VPLVGFKSKLIFKSVFSNYIFYKNQQILSWSWLSF